MEIVSAQQLPGALQALNGTGSSPRPSADKHLLNCVQDDPDVAQPVRTLTSKLDDMSSNPRNYVVEGGHQLSKVVL